jgi:hypothetical protein
LTRLSDSHHAALNLKLDITIRCDKADQPPDKTELKELLRGFIEPYCSFMEWHLGPASEEEEHMMTRSLFDTDYNPSLDISIVHPGYPKHVRSISLQPTGYGQSVRVEINDGTEEVVKTEWGWEGNDDDGSEHCVELA